MDDIFKNYIVLRAVVVFLGEKDQFNWWNTQFLGNTGRKYLEFNFPRNTVAAGVSGASTAAKKLHDERIGKTRVFHLFRFPYEIEESIHTHLLNMEEDVLWDTITDKETASVVLTKLAGSTIDAPEGPVQVGQIKHILKEGSVAEVAKQYLSAFEKNCITLPYFSGA